MNTLLVIEYFIAADLFRFGYTYCRIRSLSTTDLNMYVIKMSDVVDQLRIVHDMRDFYASMWVVGYRMGIHDSINLCLTRSQTNRCVPIIWIVKFTIDLAHTRIVRYIYVCALSVVCGSWPTFCAGIQLVEMDY